MSRAVIYRSPRERFERAMAHDAQRADAHRVRTRFDGCYRAVCSCAWIGPGRAERTAAEADAAYHEQVVA